MMMNPGMPPRARPPAVEVKVSYKARMIGAVSIAGVVLAASAAVLVMSLLAKPPEKEQAEVVLPLCSALAAGTAMSCADKTSEGSGLYTWTVKEAGTYKLTVGKQPLLQRSLGVEKITGASLQSKFGTPGSPVVVSLNNLTPGDYRIKVGEEGPNRSKTPQPFTLVIEKKGAKPPADPEPTGKPFNPAILAFPAFGLLWLVIPLILAAEKARIPLRFDASGVTMRNGAVHPWSEFQGARPFVRVTRSGSRNEVGTELLFARGRAMVMHRPVTNYREVKPVLDALKMNLNPWA